MTRLAFREMAENLWEPHVEIEEKLREYGVNIRSKCLAPNRSELTLEGVDSETKEQLIVIRLNSKSDGVSISYCTKMKKNTPPTLYFDGKSPVVKYQGFDKMIEDLDRIKIGESA